MKSSLIAVSVAGILGASQQKQLDEDRQHRERNWPERRQQL
jgi:hypothetical protein